MDRAETLDGMNRVSIQKTIILNAPETHPVKDMICIVHHNKTHLYPVHTVDCNHLHFVQYSVQLDEDCAVIYSVMYYKKCVLK